jgi:hypothetical protein
MHVKAKNTPASAPGGHTWENEHQIVEVPDNLGTDLLRIGQFTEVLPTDPEHPLYVEPEPDGDPGDPEDGLELLEPPRTGPQASKQAWRDYADALGVDYPEGASRDTLIQLVDTRNLISE